MLKLLIIVFAFVGLVGCEETVVTREYRVGMEVIHSQVGHKGITEIDLRQIGTNSVYRRKTINCWYSQVGKKVVGTKWDITWQDFKRGDRYGSRMVGLNGICDSIR